MLSLRSPRRSPLARSVAHILILAFVGTLVPLESSAFIPAKAEKLTKSAFGELVAHTGTDPQPYAFTGEPLDANSGFQYHRARWYAPGVGRFAGMDAWQGNPFEPATLHKYLYVQSSPIDGRDPSGLFGEFSIAGFATAAFIGGVINSIATPNRQGIAGAFDIFLRGAVLGAGLYTGFGAGVVFYRLVVGLGAAAVATAPYSKQALENLANSGGPTVGVTTAQSTAPILGRGLYVVEGVGPQAQQVARTFGPDRVLFEAQVPRALLTALERIGLAERGYLPNGTQIYFFPEASEFVVRFFTKVSG